MEEEDLLESALEFFGLDRKFTEEDFRLRYRELAKKYHPDSSEFTSNILFNELVRSKETLENHLIQRKTIPPNQESQPSPKKSSDPSYEFYKKAKEFENESILKYFEKTKGNPVFLESEENPPLRELIHDLQLPLDYYRKILEEYPNSIWARDAKDSIQRLQIWLFGRGSVGGKDDGIGRS